MYQFLLAEILAHKSIEINIHLLNTEVLTLLNLAQFQNLVLSDTSLVHPW